jgi:preprotein translocase subunit SecD
MTKLKAGIVGTVILAVAATSLVVQQQRRAELQRAELQQQNQRLRDQIARLQLDQERPSRRAADPAASRSLNSDRLRELLKLRGEVGRLRQQAREFQQAAATAKGPRPLAESASASASAPNRPPPFQLQLVVDEPGENTQTMTNYALKNAAETLNVQKTPLMDGAAISSAAVTLDSATGRPQIEVEFSDVGKELFAAITRENLDKKLAIVLDGQIYSTPVIRSEIPDGKAVVTGSFTEDEARTLAAKINEALQPK